MSVLVSVYFWDRDKLNRTYKKKEGHKNEVIR